MAVVPTRALRFDVNESDATPIQGAICTARLNVSDIYQEEVVDRVLESTTTDVNGQATLNLFPNVLGERNTVYVVTIRHPDTNRAILKTVIRMPDSDVDLADIAGNAVDDGVVQAVPGISQLVGPGFVVKKSDQSYVTRKMVAGNGITIADGDGDDGDPTIAINPTASIGLASLALSTFLAVGPSIVDDGQYRAVIRGDIGAGRSALNLRTNPGATPTTFNRVWSITDEAFTAQPFTMNLSSDVVQFAAGNNYRMALQTNNKDMLFNVGVVGAINALTIAGTTGQLQAGTDGSAAAPAYAFSGNPATGVYRAGSLGIGFAIGGSNDAIALNDGTNTGFRIATNAMYCWTSSTDAAAGATDLLLARDAANTLALRNGANGQVFRIYNTFTDASNYERGAVRWNGLVFETGTENAGTGGARSHRVKAAHYLAFNSGGSDRWQLEPAGHIQALSDNAYDIGASGANRPRTGYFGTGVAVGPAGLIGNHVATLSRASDARVDIRSQTVGHAVLRLISNNTTNATIDAMTGDFLTPKVLYLNPNGGAVQIGSGGIRAADGSPSAPAYSFASDTDLGFYTVSSRLAIQAGAGFWIGSFGSQGPFGELMLKMRGSGAIGWAPSTTESDIADLLLHRDSANVLAQRNGVNIQTFRLYKTYTDAANYERLALLNDGTTFYVQTQSAGTGAARDLLLGTNGVASLHFSTNSTLRWRVDSTGHFIAQTNNALDIGDAAGNRPRTGYFGTSVVTPQVGSGGTGSINFTTSGGTQFVVEHIASAVNYLGVSGSATGGNVNIQARGSDTDIALVLSSQGSDPVGIYTSAFTALQFRVAHTASAVNYLQATGAAAAGSVVLSAAGSDADVGLIVRSKGTDGVLLETGGGTQVEVANTASAVNYVQLKGGATGSPSTVTIAAVGSDANVNINAVPKGTGVLQSGGVAVCVAGKQAIPIPAQAMTPRSANGCAPLATTNGAANQPDVPYLAFDGAAQEYAGFYMRMPKGWNEGTVTAAFSWRRASGVGAANVVWGIRAVAISDNESPAATFGSEASVTDAASTTTANMNVSGETSACTIGGTPAEGDLVFFEVFRDADNASDTLDAVDALLTEVTLFITTNAPNDA